MNRRTPVSFAIGLLILFAAPSLIAGTGGYVMITSADAGGPAVEWIDISASGTLVTGLADDNSASALSLPEPFTYFGTQYNSIKIGSNGWVSFENTSNIATCFQPIPTAGGAGDTFMAPYLADLNFTGAGNPGTVRTFHDVAGGRFIISYINVPYWVINAPGWAGSTNFQIVLDFATSTIRFNYLTLTAFTNNAACIDMVVGIEGPGGVDGIQYANDTSVPDSFAILFLPPGEIEVTPASGLVTAESGATTANFDVVLGTPPTSDVVIPISSSDLTEGTLTASSLTFTATDWDTPQTVTVTGADDAIVDGPVAYTIILGAATSADSRYNNLDATDVALTNNDDDTATLIISDANTVEGTGSNPQVTFDVTVDKAVAGGFTVKWNTTDGSATAPSDYTTDGGTLSFVGNAGEVQTIQVTVIGDTDPELDHNFTVNLGTPSNASVIVSDGEGSATIIDDDSADLSVTLSDSPDPVVAGEELTYTAIVSNDGPLTANNVTLTMPLPANTSFVSGSVSGGGTCSGSPIVCTATNIAPSASQTATITLEVAPSTASGTTINATITAASAVPDTNAANDSDATTTTVGDAAADLQLTLTSDAAQAPSGAPVTFTASSANSGPSDAQSLQITIALSANLRYVSHTPDAGSSCTTPAVGNTGSIVCTWAGATAPGTTRTLAVTADSIVLGTHTVDATTSSPTADSSVNEDSVSLIVVERPTISKSFAPSSIDTGAISVLTITLGNANAAPITGVAFTDTYPANLQNAATPNASTTCLGGTLTAGANGGSVSYSGGTIPAGGCTVTVSVTSSVAGVYANTIAADALTSDSGSNLAPATATLTVAAVAATAAIPTLSQTMLLLLSACIGAIAFVALRRS